MKKYSLFDLIIMIIIMIMYVVTFVLFFSSNMSEVFVSPFSLVLFCLLAILGLGLFILYTEYDCRVCEVACIGLTLSAAPIISLYLIGIEDCVTKYKKTLWNN